MHDFVQKSLKEDIARVSYKKDNFLFIGGKMLQRQNVPATKHLGTNISGMAPKGRHQKVEDPRLKMRSHTQQRKHIKIKFILATRIFIK